MVVVVADVVADVVVVATVVVVMNVAVSDPGRAPWGSRGRADDGGSHAGNDLPAAGVLVTPSLFCLCVDEERGAVGQEMRYFEKAKKTSFFSVVPAGRNSSGSFKNRIRCFQPCTYISYVFYHMTYIHTWKFIVIRMYVYVCMLLSFLTYDT